MNKHLRILNRIRYWQNKLEDLPLFPITEQSVRKSNRHSRHIKRLYRIALQVEYLKLKKTSPSIRSHEFEIHGGNKPKDGTNKWPDCLYLAIPKWHAWNIIQDLLTQLKDGNDEHCDLAFIGELKINIPDE